MGMIIAPSRFGVAGYSEIGTIGNSTDSSAAYSMGGGEYMNVWDIVIPSGGVWFKKLVVKFQQVDAGVHVRPVFYNGHLSSSNLIATGQDITLSAIPASTPGVDVDLQFRSDGAATFLAAGTIGMGIQANGTFVDVKAAPGGTVYWHSDTYSDGPLDPFGSGGGTSSRTPLVYIPYSVNGP
jgi:hypothetical protein